MWNSRGSGKSTSCWSVRTLGRSQALPGPWRVQGDRRGQRAVLMLTMWERRGDVAVASGRLNAAQALCPRAGTSQLPASRDSLDGGQERSILPQSLLYIRP